MYHSIATSAARRFTRFVVSPEAFAAQMDRLAAEGYETVTALDLARSYAGSGLPARPVVLTFDDAYTDFETAVLPVLQRYGFRATLYVPTAYVGRTALWLRDCDEDQRAILSWHSLRDVAAAGIEVASHTHTHPQLDRIALPAARAELQRSREMLEDNLGLPVEGLAYPFGYWNARVRSNVSGAGYSYACAVGELAVRAGADLLTLPRLTVAGGLSIDVFARLLTCSSTRAGRLAVDAKRLAWRAMRRHIRAVGGDPQPVQQQSEPVSARAGDTLGR